MNNEPSQVERIQQQADRLTWSSVKSEPSPEQMQALDQELPEEWQATLADEQQFDHEVLDPLSEMSDQELHALLDIPPGDIDQNTQQALEELGLDVESLLHDITTREQVLETPERDQHDDFGR